MLDAPLLILLLEADAVTQELYARELRRHYRVLTCQDGAQALQILHIEDICAVILEPGLANGTGWRLLDDIRRLQKTSPLPIILCSVLDERRRGIGLGAAAYLVKPVLPATLRNTLDQILRG